MINPKIFDNVLNIFKKFKNIILIGFFVLFILLAALTIYLNHVGYKSILNLNSQQKNLSQLLGKWNNLKLRQKNVENMLEKNKNFKLGFYINNLIKEKNLDAKTSSPIVQQLEKTSYEEVTQVLTVNNSNTQVLVQLLELIENNELVYIKKMEIIQQIKNITFALTLATLQLKVKINERQ
jgi:hypothetical protein